MQDNDSEAAAKIRAVHVEQRLDWQQLLKTVGHPDVLKLYMFLLERYATLDSAALHAVTSYLKRVAGELKLAPMLYQVHLLLFC